jgi:hypothetical protein
MFIYLPSGYVNSLLLKIAQFLKFVDLASYEMVDLSSSLCESLPEGRVNSNILQLSKTHFWTGVFHKSCDHQYLAGQMLKNNQSKKKRKNMNNHPHEFRPFSTNVGKTIINHPFGNGLYMFIPPIYGGLG